MQIALQAIPTNYAVTSSNTVVRAEPVAPSTTDLKSSIQPVQPTPSTESSSFSNPPAVTYNRFAQLTRDFSSAPREVPATQEAERANVSNGANQTSNSAEQSDSSDTPELQQSSNAVPRESTSGQEAPDSVEGQRINVQSQNPASNETANNGNRQPSETPGRSNVGGLTPEELELVQELAARDREVRAHEQTHVAVGGRYASAPQYTFERGPDGLNYAVGGEVSIDVSPIPGDPEATIRKMEQVKRAATAPAEPSSQDLSVAATATQAIVQARAELAVQQQDERNREAEEAEQRREEQAAEENQASPGEREREAIRTYLDLIQVGVGIDRADESFIDLSEVV